MQRKHKLELLAQSVVLSPGHIPWGVWPGTRLAQNGELKVDFTCQYDSVAKDECTAKCKNSRRTGGGGGGGGGLYKS